MAKRKLKRKAKIARSYCAKRATVRRKRAAKKSLLDKILSF